MSICSKLIMSKAQTCVKNCFKDILQLYWPEKGLKKVLAGINREEVITLDGHTVGGNISGSRNSVDSNTEKFGNGTESVPGRTAGSQ